MTGPEPGTSPSLAPAPAASPTASKVGTVLRVTSGNFMEMFDFFLFGFYATHISRTFFPAGSPSYDEVAADVWFRDEQSAAAAGFAHWDADQR